MYGGDDDKQWQFEDLLAELEDVHQCSGICSGYDDKDPFEIFIYSNINNGDPVQSCRGPLEEFVSDHINYFYTVYLVIYLVTGAVILLLVILMACQIFLYCRNKCRRQKMQEPKKRAANGMVLGQDDQEIAGPDPASGQKDVEMADRGDRLSQDEDESPSKVP